MLRLRAVSEFEEGVSAIGILLFTMWGELVGFWRVSLADAG